CALPISRCLGAPATGNPGGHGGPFRASFRCPGWAQRQPVQRNRPALARRSTVAGDPGPATPPGCKSGTGFERIAAAVSTLGAGGLAYGLLRTVPFGALGATNDSAEPARERARHASYFPDRRHAGERRSPQKRIGRGRL